MARLNKLEALSVVIPTLNEASNLPLLLADLHRWPSKIDISVIDSGSSDLTPQLAQIGGARLIKASKQNRGNQLHTGSCHALNDWLLFLHADSRIPAEWPVIIKEVINDQKAKNYAWFFNFKIDSKDLKFRVMEWAVNIRSKFLQRPYGDQGLLIHQSLYKKVGGYNPLYLMEDLDLVQRISKQTQLRSLGISLHTNGRAWENIGILSKALKNAILRYKWQTGESSKKLLEEYSLKNR